MSAESTRWSRRYLQLADSARANAARCTEREMRDEFLEVASCWEQMAGKIGDESDRQVPQDKVRSSRAPDRECSQDWRQIAHAGFGLIVKELNDAIDGQEFGTISLVSERSALDFWFGERVFRLVLKSHVAWRPWDYLADEQVYLVLVRRAWPDGFFVPAG